MIFVRYHPSFSIGEIFLQVPFSKNFVFTQIFPIQFLHGQKWACLKVNITTKSEDKA